MVEELVSLDDAVMERYLEEGDISADEIRRLLREATIKSTVVPVLCGSAFKNKGVQNLLDAVVDYLPSPKDVPPIVAVDAASGEEIRLPSDDDGPLAALVFKIMTDPFVGQLTFFRHLVKAFPQFFHGLF